MIQKEEQNFFIKEKALFINELKSKFFNFCKNSPIPISFKIVGIGEIHVKEHINGETIVFPFDVGEDLKIIVRRIKEWLCENKYPVMIQKVSEMENYNPSEYLNMIENENIGWRDVLTKKKYVNRQIKWRIEKVFVPKDEFIVRNLETNEVHLYKFIHMPCTLFLKRFRENKYSEDNVWSFFLSKSQYIRKCIEVDKDNNPIEVSNSV